MTPTRIEILGFSTRAKRSFAGNQTHAHGTILVTKSGGEADLFVSMKSDEGDARLALTRESAAQLIEALREVYPSLRN